MIRILKFAKKSWYIMVAIVGMLVIQAYCDLALPEYTSNIVDVGIQYGGIEEKVPKVIRESEYNALKEFMTKEQQKVTEEAYTLLNKENVSEQEYNKYLKKYPALLHENLYELKEEVNIEVLEQTMLPAISQKSGIPIEQIGISYVKAEYEAIGMNLAHIQSNYILKNGSIMLLIAFVGMLIAAIAGYLASKLAAGTSMDIRNQIFRKVVSFSNGEMEQFSTASLITRSTNDIQQVQMVLVMIFRLVAFAPIMGIGGIIKVLQTSVSMSWIIGIAVVAIGCVVTVLMVVAMPKFKKMQTLVDRVNLVTREILSGLLVVRAFSREEHEEKRFDTANRDLMRTQLFTSRAMAIMNPFIMLIMNGITILIIWAGAKGIDAGDLQVGQMMAYITYTMQVVMSFLMITMISIMLPRATVAAVRIDEVLNSETMILDTENPKSLPKDGKGEVTFHNISFQYPGAEEDALTDIDFTAKPGEITAIIGSTGCGKSTLVHLIPRLFDVTKGSITIDGVDIRDITQKELRDNIGFVPQKGILFSGTIASNLQFGKDEASEEEMKEATDIAQANEFIESKPEGMETSIAQGGANVSGGQKQRLSIARAIVKKPKIYVFDDSFSALDYKTDVALRKALRENTAESTVIIVAQRISTILHAEKIIVLDDGKIAGIGTHEELLANNEIYQQIAISQLGKEELEKSSRKGDM